MPDTLPLVAHRWWLPDEGFNYDLSSFFVGATGGAPLPLIRSLCCKSRSHRQSVCTLARMASPLSGLYCACAWSVSPLVVEFPAAQGHGFPAVHLSVLLAWSSLMVGLILPEPR